MLIYVGPCRANGRASDRRSPEKFPIFNLLNHLLDMQSPLKFSALLPFLFAFLAIGLVSCDKESMDDAFQTRFIVENATAIELRVQAKDGPDTFIVLGNSVAAPGERTTVYSYGEATQRDVLPSEVFTEFRLFTKVGLKDSVIYNRVRNTDWDPGTQTDAYQELILTIQ